VPPPKNDTRNGVRLMIMSGACSAIEKGNSTPSVGDLIQPQLAILRDHRQIQRPVGIGEDLLHLIHISNGVPLLWGEPFPQLLVVAIWQDPDLSGFCRRIEEIDTVDIPQNPFHSRTGVERVRQPVEAPTVQQYRSPRAQLDAIASLDLNDTFHLDGAKVIAHPDPLPPSPTGAPVIRHASATTPCYAELVIKRLVFAKNALAGGALQAFFIFRRFGQGDVQSFTSMADTPLTIFPWKNPEDQERGKAELSEALRSDLLTFAKYSNKPFVRRR